jgi:hypothetical protein
MNKINLNQKVKFKLTKIGREYLKKNKKLMWSDKEGYSTEQLWVVMGIFGQAMQYPTMNTVIEPDIFLVDD